ncbi:MAG: restriction endonuclease subunit S [Methylophaga sp.]|uniref:restriction endonuclease subunit S n=1 Tax=Methylophaga sp. TaxID=2024840 RepID=UPI000C0E3D03|nr:restriction endonuclease subunit S [Methylophaga sp.]MBL1456657.1 restriction endonuclease subunit S [Methylophaga sp.]
MNKTVPEGWVEARFQDIADLVKGLTYSTNDYSTKENGHPFITLKCIQKNGGFSQRGLKYYSGKFKESQVVEAGDVVFANTDLTRDGDVVGSPLLVPSIYGDKPALISMDLSKVVPKKSNDGGFIYYWLQTNQVKRQMINLSAGSTVLHLNTADVPYIHLIKPPYPQQQKIATILSSVDDVIEKTRAQIDKLKDLKTGMMQELLTKGIGHTEYKDSPVGIIPASWEVLNLQAICTSKYAIVDGPFGSNLKTEHYRDSGIPVFQSGLVTSNKFVKRDYVYVNEEKYQEQFRSSAGPGDILMAKIGMRAGACAIIPEGHPMGILAGNSLKITVDSDKAKNSFILNILHFLQDTGQIRRLLTETAQPAVSITTLKKMLIALPPMSEQNAIGDFLTSLDRKLESATKKSNSYKLLKRALMQDLLTGKVRVNVENHQEERMAV